MSKAILLADDRTKVPASPEWLHEIKYEGFERERRNVRCRNVDCSDRLRDVAALRLQRAAVVERPPQTK
jgi:hypothetical protein